MEKEQDFTQQTFILRHPSEGTSKHPSEESARNAMGGYEQNCVIICVSSLGSTGNPIAQHKPKPTGDIKGKIIYQGKLIPDITANEICNKAMENFGYPLRNAANEARELASGKRACA